jgi:hypothetical protein
MNETRRGVGAEKARERKRREVRGPYSARTARRERRRGLEVRTLMGRLERKRVLSVSVVLGQGIRGGGSRGLLRWLNLG